jgi:hypothetical protein
LRSAGGVFTDQFTFGFGTERFGTLPVTVGFGTNRLALGFGRLTMGDTVGGFADIYAFGTISHFASFVRTHRSAVRSK